jgi:hypothetical protein
MQKKTSFFVWKPWHMVVLAAVCGLAVGALTFVAQGLLPGTLNHFANSGAVWLAPAFFIAALMPGWKGAALVSTEMLLGEVLGYYGLAALVLGTGFGFFVALWTGTALVGGPLAGVAGFWWRHARFAWRVVAVAFLGGVFIAEGIFLLLSGASAPGGVGQRGYRCPHPTGAGALRQRADLRASGAAGRRAARRGRVPGD